MTYAQALKKAKAAAKRRNEPMWVVREYDADAFGPAEYNYANREDLDTYFVGLSDRHILAYVSPDGTVETE